jgi:DNA-directed RNA polymerase specialized sigma24 family protein
VRSHHFWPKGPRTYQGVNHYRALKRALSYVTAADKRRTEAEEGYRLRHCGFLDASPASDVMVERHDFCEVLLSGLAHREREIVVERTVFTLRETARLHGLSHECIRQLEARALRKMRGRARLELGEPTCSSV